MVECGVQLWTVTIGILALESSWVVPRSHSGSCRRACAPHVVLSIRVLLLVLSQRTHTQVYPEHKYLIVEALRQEGFAVGMTGDGVNDAPALKRADVGIAVEGATDAARAAADMVLTQPGLSVIVHAIEIARAIFLRMKNFINYR